MKIGLARPILTQKKTKQYMEQRYPHLTISENSFWQIIHIYGDRAIFLLFCDHHDT